MKEMIPLRAEEPIACSLDGPGLADRLAEFRQLFAEGLVGRDRTPEGIRFRFRATESLEARVRDLARRENECCPFFTFTITVAGGEVLWDASVPDDARPILDELYRLPENVGAPSLVPPAVPNARRKVLTTGIAAVLCALACALPVLGAALVSGATARLIGIPVWVVVLLAVAFITVWAWRRSRRTTKGDHGC